MEYSSTRRRGIRPAGAFVVLVLIVAAAVVVFHHRDSSWNPARVIPRNAVFALSIDASSTSQKQQALHVVQAISRDAGLDSSLNRLLARFRAETGLDLKEDVLPLTNMRAIVAVLDEPIDGEPQIVAALGTGNPSAASRLEERFLKAASDSGCSTSRINIHGTMFNRISAPGSTAGKRPELRQPLLIGRVSQALVFTNAVEAAKAVVEASRSARDSILTVPDYRRAAASDSSAVASAYIADGGISKFGGALQNMDSAMAQSVEVLGNRLRSGRMQLRAGGDGIVMDAEWEAASGSGIQLGSSSERDLRGLAAMAPETSGIFIGMAGWDNFWKLSTEQLRRNPDGRRVLEQLSRRAESTVGFDPIKEVLDQAASLAVFFVPKKTQGFAIPGDVILVIKPTDMKRMQESLERMRSSMAKFLNTSVATTDTMGKKLNYTVTGFPGLPQWADTTVDDLVVVSLDQRSIQDLLKRQGSRGKDLLNAEDYRKIKRLLPRESTSLLYVNAGPIFDTFEANLSKEENQKAKRVLKRIRTVAIGASQTDAGKMRVVVAVPFQ